MKRIVVDSSASLYKLDGVDFAAVPLKIVTDEREYLDDGTLDAVEMATTLRTYKGKTSTSCPNIGDWLEAYEGADEIYAITITGTLSGSCNAAQLAADGWYSSGEETMMHAVWNGTFYKDDGPNEWLYADGQPFYRAIVTDATGTTWTFEMPLQEK